MRKPLSIREKWVARWRFVSGYKLRYIGELLSLSSDSVRVIIFRALIRAWWDWENPPWQVAKESLKFAEKLSSRNAPIGIQASHFLSTPRAEKFRLIVERQQEELSHGMV